MDPSRSVAYNGKLFVMGSWGLDVGLDIYDIRGSRTPYRLARHDFEDHNNGAVLIRTGKPMVTLWTRHAKDSLVRYRVGAVNVENATTRTDYLGTAEHTYTASDRTTYQVAMDINGTIWVFNRIGLARWRCVPPRRGAPAVSPGLRRSRTCTPPTASRCTQQRSTSARRSVPPAQPPRQWCGVAGVYYGEINTTTGAVTGASRAALGTLGTEINHSALQTVYVPPAGWSTWIYDVGDNPSIRELTFVEFDPATRTR